MMDKIIVCDKCGHEGCSVDEVRPASEKISMKDFARQAKSPFEMNNWNYQSEQKKREYIISCPECGKSVQYAVMPKCPSPFYSLAEVG